MTPKKEVIMARPKEHSTSENEPIIIKKYANRRLYDTRKSSYVTLDDLAQMIKDKIDFKVVDAKSGEDLTRSVLTQIIVEEENKGENLLPLDFLKQIIGFYGENMQTVIPQYLEQSMKVFNANQERIQDYFQNAFSGMFPFENLEEMGKQNREMMEKTFEMMNPFAGQAGDNKGAFNPVDQMQNMQEQIMKMQKDMASMMQSSIAAGKKSKKTDSDS